MASGCFLQAVDNRHKGSKRVRCPKCKEACRFLGPKVTVPPKRDVAAWKQLREDVNKHSAYWTDEIRKQNVKRKHQIEKRIAEIESRPPNDERKRLIRNLTAEMEELA